MRVYERGICQNLHFDHRWYIFPSLILQSCSKSADDFKKIWLGETLQLRQEAKQHFDKREFGQAED